MTYGDEVRRKLIHIGAAAFPIAYLATDRTVMLWILFPLAAIAVVLETLRHSRPDVRALIDRLLGRVLRQEEAHWITGATCVTFGTLLSILLFEKQIAVAVLLFLTVSDALASLVGIRWGRTRFLGKSLAGSLTFFISAFVIGFCVLPHAPVVAVAGALTGTIVEALPLRVSGQKLDDNLSIPLITGAVMTILQAVLP